MGRFESEFALHLLDKIQIADRDRFRPPTFSRHPLTRDSMIAAHGSDQRKVLIQR